MCEKSYSVVSPKVLWHTVLCQNANHVANKAAHPHQLKRDEILSKSHRSISTLPILPTNTLRDMPAIDYARIRQKDQERNHRRSHTRPRVGESPIFPLPE